MQQAADFDPDRLRLWPKISPRSPLQGITWWSVPLPAHRRTQQPHVDPMANGTRMMTGDEELRLTLLDTVLTRLPTGRRLKDLNNASATAAERAGGRALRAYRATASNGCRDRDRRCAVGAALHSVRGVPWSSTSCMINGPMLASDLRSWSTRPKSISASPRRARRAAGDAVLKDRGVLGRPGPPRGGPRVRWRRHRQFGRHPLRACASVPTTTRNETWATASGPAPTLLMEADRSVWVPTVTR